MDNGSEQGSGGESNDGWQQSVSTFVQRHERTIWITGVVVVLAAAIGQLAGEFFRTIKRKEQDQ